MQCISCKSVETHQVYIPQNSRRDARVMECHSCGLVQTHHPTQYRKERTLSADADWGNVRHAKPLRLNAQKTVLSEAILAINPDASILDVGASRGHFYTFLRQLNPNAFYEGVESDESLEAFSVSNGLLKFGKFEEIQNNLSRKKYDFLFLNHTLEHVDHPRTFLRMCYELMRDESLIWIDVPNLEAINKRDNVEEFFIDKHRSHFTMQSLLHLIKSVGMEVVNDYSDVYNLVLLCKLSKFPNIDGQNNVDCIQRTIDDYETLLLKNRGKLKTIASRLNSIGQGALIFGGGRILDSLIKFGNLKVTDVQVCDTYLHEYGQGFGYEIQDPRKVKWDEVSLVLVLARSSSGTIYEYVRGQYSGPVEFFVNLMRN